MSDVPEHVIVNTFSQAFHALAVGRHSGTITRAQENQLIDALGACFRDYVIMHRALIDANRALEKARNAAQAKPSKDLS